jgi:Tol biopolymer transport system component
VPLFAVAISLPWLTPSQADDAAKGKICYARKEGDGYLLHVMDADGKNDRLLPNQPAKANLMPAWSPDGKQIAFMAGASTRGMEFGVYLIGVDGSNLKRFVPEEKMAGLPAWAPDGKSLAFVADRNNKPQLMSVNADGSGARLLDVGMGFAIAPFFSPDGKRLAFTGGTDPNNERELGLFTAGPDGSQPQKLTTAAGIVLGGPGAWSPDGSTIAYAAVDPQKKEASLHLWLVADKVDNRIASFKIGNEELDGLPVSGWSPDGKWLVICQAGDDGKAGIWRISADGQTKERLSPADVVCASPAWSRG